MQSKNPQKPVQRDTSSDESEKIPSIKNKIKSARFKVGTVECEKKGGTPARDFFVNEIDALERGLIEFGSLGIPPICCTIGRAGKYYPRHTRAENRLRCSVAKETLCEKIFFDKNFFWEFPP